MEVVANPVKSPTIADVKVFWPAIVCAKVVINPVDPELATGILNVWVEPEELMLNTLPEVPVAKYWLLSVMEFKFVNPDAALETVMATQLKLPIVSDCNTELPVDGVVAGSV